MSTEEQLALRQKLLEPFPERCKNGDGECELQQNRVCHGIIQIISHIEREYIKGGRDLDSAVDAARKGAEQVETDCEDGPNYLPDPKFLLGCGKKDTYSFYPIDRHLKPL